MTRRLLPLALLALLALGACDDAQGKAWRTPEGRARCATLGGQVFDSPVGDNIRTRYYRLVLDTALVERPGTTRPDR